MSGVKKYLDEMGRAGRSGTESGYEIQVIG